jgi:phosphatidylglycerophosphatase A
LNVADVRPIIRPSVSFMLSHPAHILALGFGTGLAPVAPGTVGTLLGFPIYALLAQWLAPAAILGVAGLMFLVGIWACGRTATALGVSDHSGINWDEIAAFVAILVFTPPGLAWQAAAFLLFRAFDVIKPPPIRYFDRTVKGGFGVMLDDVLAAGYTLLVLAVAAHLLG